MPWRQIRYTLRVASAFATSIGLILCGALASPVSAASRCGTTLSRMVGASQVKALQDQMVKAERKFRPQLSALPQELAYSVSENLPLLRRADLLNPIRPRPRIYVDAYHGSEYVSESADVQILPSDQRALCLLLPGRAVFLSDGTTHHFSLIYSVDYNSERVRFLDPWAQQSFLLEGKNNFGIKARAFLGTAKQPLLDISFDDFLKVWRGSIEELNSDIYFSGIEAFYPELRRREDYLFWKYSRTFAVDSFQMTILSAIEFTHDFGSSSRGKLKLLARWADDYIIGVISNFSVDRPGHASGDAVPQLRQAFLKRLPEYANVLPWNLKWLLLDRTSEGSDTSLRLAMADAFLSASPTDTDFQIARGETLLRLGRYEESLQQLGKAEEQWKQDVASAIQTASADEAVRVLLSRDFYLQSLAVFHWRKVRIRLFADLARGLAKPNAQFDFGNELATLQREYVIGSVAVDFLGEILRLASVTRAAGERDKIIRAAATIRYDNERLETLAAALYKHFVSVETISGISAETASALRSSKLGDALCDLNGAGRIVTGLQKELEGQLGAFCRRKKRPPESGLVSRDTSPVIAAMGRAALSTEREHAYCGSYFAFFTDREH